MIRKPSSLTRGCHSHRRLGLFAAGCALFALISAVYLPGCCAPGAGQAATPTFDPNGGTFTASVDVAIACATDGATIRYTTNGSDPTASSTEYGGPVTLKATTTIKARAFVAGLADSEVASATFTVDPPAGQVAAPEFNPNGGTFTGSVDVTISTATSGATVRYTTDGSDPDATSTQYANPVHLTATTTLKARAFKTGLTDSEVGSATFTVNPTQDQVDAPAFNPNGGTFLQSVAVAISSATTGATIRYTTDGSTPTSSQGTIYAGAFTLSASATVKAIAYKSGMADSDVASAAFVVTSTTRVSVNSIDTEGNGDSAEPSISGDGRYVAFETLASNLPVTSGIYLGDNNGVSDIFVRDRQTGKTLWVSSSQGDGGSYSPSISADGMYVAFQSDATNLVTGDTQGFSDIFVRDRGTGQITRVTIKGITGPVADGHSYNPSISADGRYVAFESEATNLVDDDTEGKRDIFVVDRQTAQVTRVSVDSAGVAANAHCYRPSISADGQYVAFQSAATNLVAGDGNGKVDIFVRDLEADQTTRVSVNSLGDQGNDNSVNASISADGRYVAFESVATNLPVTDGVYLADLNGVSDIFVHDRQTDQTAWVSSSQGDGGSHDPSISSDGQCVAFTSLATNLIDGGLDSNGKADIFVRDRQAFQTTRVSIDSAGIQGNDVSRLPSISSDGRYVAFDSDATNLVDGDNNGSRDVFVRDQGE